MFLPQTGKLHFGVILGWSVVHSAVLWFLVNQVGASAGQRVRREGAGIGAGT